MIYKSKIIDDCALKSDSDLYEPLDVLIKSLNEEANLSRFGSFAVEYQIKQHLKNRSKISDAYLKVVTPKVSKPIIVIGLPRSGTTFLFNLLSKDPSNRSPLFWEMMKPLPILKKNTFRERARIIRSDLILSLKDKLIPKLDDLHKITSSSPEECLLIKVLALQSILYFYMANTPLYLDYLSSCDTRKGYAWHHKFLSIMEAENKPERWLLKDPSHLGNLEEILEFYPDANFVHIVRDPAETLPSICSLTAQVRKGFSKDVNLKDLGKKTLKFWELSNNKNESQKSRLPEGSYLQVRYRDLLDDPINLVKEIYRSFSFNLDDLTVTEMKNYVEEGSREARTPHKYSLEDYGLARAEVHNKLSYS